MKTTVIGSFPYEASTPNWFNKNEDISGLATHLSTKQYTKYIDNNKNIIPMISKLGTNIILRPILSEIIPIIGCEAIPIT